MRTTWEAELADPIAAPAVTAAVAVTVAAAIANVIPEGFLTCLRRLDKMRFRSDERIALGFHPSTAANKRTWPAAARGCDAGQGDKLQGTQPSHTLGAVGPPHCLMPALRMAQGR